MNANAPFKGIACMITGSALLTLSDAVVKWVTASLPVGQILCLRNAFTLAFILLFVFCRSQLKVLRIYNVKAQFFRAFMMIFSTFGFVGGLSLLPLADTIAVAFTGPLLLTVLASLCLREKVGWRRWAAVAAGFVGVVIMFQPGGNSVQWALLLPLLASFAGALRDIVTRYMSSGESSLATLFFATSVVMLAGLVTVFFGWQWPNLVILGLLAISGLLAGCAHFLLIETFRWAEASLVAPFKYSTLLWGVLFGFLFWGDIPQHNVIIGAVLVVLSGFYILHRESKVRRILNRP